MKARSCVAIMVSSIAACGCTVNDQSNQHGQPPGDYRDGSPSPLPPMTARGFTYGATTGSDESGVGARSLVGFPIQIPTDGVLIGIGFITTQASGQHMYLGLYPDVQGQPGRAIRLSDELTVAVGTNEVVVPSTRVTAGAYWMVALSDGTTHFASNGDAVEAKLATATYGPLSPVYQGSFGVATGKAPNVYVRMLHWTDFGL